LQLRIDLYFEGVDEVECGGEGAPSAEGFKYFWESAMPTAAQVIDVAARMILPSMFDLVRDVVGVEARIWMVRM
jgi:hypothetical protein